MTWVHVSDRLPEIDGDAVLGVAKIAPKCYCIIGAVKLTTKLGDLYKDEPCGSGPVWEVLAPYSEEITFPIEPDGVEYWMPIPPIPGESTKP